MRRIKLFESFVNSGLESNIKDILVELNDIGLDYYVSSHKNVIEVEISKEMAQRDDEDFDWGYDAGREETNLFNFEDESQIEVAFKSQ